MRDCTKFWGFQCRECFNCIRRKFYDFNKYLEFIEEKEFTPKKNAKRIFDRENSITVYWCTKGPSERAVICYPGIGGKKEKAFERCPFIDC
jgi:hypothetical protein